MEVHAYKCPGHLVSMGIRHLVKTVDSSDKLSEGWFFSLEQAAKFAGPIALDPPKELTKKQKDRFKKLEGLSATAKPSKSKK